MMNKDSQTAVEAILDHRFKDESLLALALTHPSLSGVENYQRLEFLGDRVLGLVVSTWVYAEFAGDDEGKLNRRYSSLVQGKTLAALAEKLGLAVHINMAESAAVEGAATKPAVLADIVESLIGALYLDGGYDVAERFIKQHLQALIHAEFGVEKDAKTQLQEWAQARDQSLPQYSEVGRTGPDHNPEFIIRATMDDGVFAEASGTSKRAAEQAAAKMLLGQLEQI